MAGLIEGILETALYADDLDAAEMFYGGILGLQCVQRSGNRHVFFRCGPGMLLIFNPAETGKTAAADSAFPVPAHGTHGPGHACFRVAAADMDRMAAKLRDANIRIEADFHWPNGVRSFYFRDPAGNSLECAEPALWTMKET